MIKYILILPKVSKDVKKIRQFEEGLLRNYQRYLEILEQTIKGELYFYSANILSTEYMKHLIIPFLSIPKHPEKKKYRRSRKHLQKVSTHILHVLDRSNYMHTSILICS